MVLIGLSGRSAFPTRGPLFWHRKGKGREVARSTPPAKGCRDPSPQEAGGCQTVVQEGSSDGRVLHFRFGGWPRAALEEGVRSPQGRGFWGLGGWTGCGGTGAAGRALPAPGGACGDAGCCGRPGADSAGRRAEASPRPRRSGMGSVCAQECAPIAGIRVRASAGRPGPWVPARRRVRVRAWGPHSPTAAAVTARARWPTPSLSRPAPRAAQPGQLSGRGAASAKLRAGGRRQTTTSPTPTRSAGWAGVQANGRPGEGLGRERWYVGSGTPPAAFA